MFLLTQDRRGGMEKDCSSIALAVFRTCEYNCQASISALLTSYPMCNCVASTHFAKQQLLIVLTKMKLAFSVKTHRERNT